VGAYDDVRLQFACSHRQCALSRRTVANGAVHYWEQCLRCGAAVKAVKKASLPLGREPEREFDNALREDWRASQELAWEAARAAASPSDFWDRYEEHMQSARWTEIRERVLVRAGGVCEGCGGRRPVHVHHATYERLGDEMLFDLFAVCRICHEKLHPRLASRLDAKVFRYTG
jgi:hypothetical protein